MLTLPRNAQIWFPDYGRGRLARLVAGGEPPRRVWVMIADHYEPLGRTCDEQLAQQCVEQWREAWFQIAGRHRDSAGEPPRYTFFYPAEEYRPFLVEPLAELARAGIGDVEVHLHHDNDTEESFLRTMTAYLAALRDQHGLLRAYAGHTAFAFIHGNWALDNSRPDGRWCGLNHEITLLARLGCYADFTMPSAGSPTQARLVNRIYWTQDDPHRPKSYDQGFEVQPGVPLPEDNADRGRLLMVPGPLGLRWKERLLPRLDTGELASYDLPTPYRVQRWIDLAPRIGTDVFVKLFAHGAQKDNMNMLLNGGLDQLFTMLRSRCERHELELHYATAWQMFEAIRRACAAVPR